VVDVIIDFLGKYLSGWLGYLIIFLVCFGETAVGLGLLVPGETVAVLGGVYAAPDAAAYVPPGNTPLELPLVLLAVSLGAVLGDNAGYLLGRRYGRRILGGGAPRWPAPPEKVAKAEAYYARHGGKTVLLGRFVPVVRSMGSLVAGTAGMGWGRFLLFEVPGAVAWSALHVLIGYALGQAFFANRDRVEGYLSWGGLGILVALVLLVWGSRKLAARRRGTIERGDS
jgi:membrane protein DedA with SNARE-associated domain